MRAWLGSACGRCTYCISGRATLCEAQHNSGYSETRKLDEINTIFADVLAGRVPARVVLEF
jgi:D-arabinose 1-dehydrogenase-like Zn-dependent alcohol dehydrogenase